MPRSPKKHIKNLPEGFGPSKKKKTQTQNKRDRKLINKLATEACNILEADLTLKIKEICNSVITAYYTSNKIKKVLITIQ
jgi:hypothetical protein